MLYWRVMGSCLTGTGKVNNGFEPSVQDVLAGAALATGGMAQLLNTKETRHG